MIKNLKSHLLFLTVGLFTESPSYTPVKDWMLTWDEVSSLRPIENTQDGKPVIKIINKQKTTKESL